MINNLLEHFHGHVAIAPLTFFNRNGARTPLGT